MELTFAPAEKQTLSISWQALVSREKLELGAVRPATVSGDLWLDENKDGARQTEEQRLSGVTLELVNPATGNRAAAATARRTGSVSKMCGPERIYCGLNCLHRRKRREKAALRSARAEALWE